MSRIGSDLPKRAGVAIALIGVAFAALWFGGLLFWALVSVAAVLMVGEWATLARAAPRDRRVGQYAISVPLAIMAPGLAAGPGFLALGFIVGAFFFVGAVTRRPQLAAGLVYVGLPVLSLLVLRAHPDGFRLTLWTMAIVWACDSGAYFAGRAIGGPKLAPAISPNKTWAGSIGGIASAVIFTVVFVLLSPSLSIGWVMIWLSPVLAVLSQAGDLYESHLKRVAGVKDSSNLLPGHGGLLDRLDGLVPVAPVAALVIGWHHLAVSGGKLWW